MEEGVVLIPGGSKGLALATVEYWYRQMVCGQLQQVRDPAHGCRFSRSSWPFLALLWGSRRLLANIDYSRMDHFCHALIRHSGVTVEESLDLP